MREFLEGSRRQLEAVGIEEIERFASALDVRALGVVIVTVEHSDVVNTILHEGIELWPRV